MGAYEDLLREGQKLRKALRGGPYIGPRGGLWADPEHTVHWEKASMGAVTALLERHFPSWGGHDEIASQIVADPGRTFDVMADAASPMPRPEAARMVGHIHDAVDSLSRGDASAADEAAHHAARIEQRWSRAEDLVGIPFQRIEVQISKRDTLDERARPYVEVVATLSRPATDDDLDHIESWVRRQTKWQDVEALVRGKEIRVGLFESEDTANRLVRHMDAGTTGGVAATLARGESFVEDEEWEDPDDPEVRLERESRAASPATRAYRQRAVVEYLGFRDRGEAETLAKRIVAHGGAVWAAQDLDEHEKAERAARAWLRHNLTEYDADLDDARRSGMHRDDHYADDKRGAMRAVDQWLQAKRGR